MQSALHYRGQAARARRLARDLTAPDDQEALERLATDLDEIAVDLENGAVEIRHPSAMPQLANGQE